MASKKVKIVKMRLLLPSLRDWVPFVVVLWRGVVLLEGEINNS